MTARISSCGTYRYTLSRPSRKPYAVAGTVLFVMLNPSTADAELDDPTIGRCRSFAETWGCNGIAVANLYALRATDPKHLWCHSDPNGPLNDYWLRQLASEFEDVVFAWGINAKRDRVAAVYEIFRHRKIWCFGTTKNGSPRHPLYVRGDTALVKWELPQ